MTESALVELPGDRLYSEDCRIQTFTYGDATSLSLIPKTQDTKKLFDIIDNRISLDVRQLTLQDLWFILYWQRINSYSSFPVKLPWKCNHCGHKNYHELRGSDLVIDDLDPEYYHGMTLDFPDAGALSLRLKLVGDELDVKKYIRDKGLTDITEEQFDAFLTACMLEPNGGTLEERIKLVESMTAGDQFLMKAFEDQFDYGVQSHTNYACEECEEVVKVRYQFDLTNFFPSLQDKPDVRSRILSSKTSVSAPGSNREDGLDEADIHQGDARQELKSSTGETEPDASSDQGEVIKKEKIEVSPEELKRMIQEGINSVTQPETEYGSLDDITGNR